MSKGKTGIARVLLAGLMLVSLGSARAHASEPAVDEQEAVYAERDASARGVDAPTAKPDAATPEKNWLHTGMNAGAIAFLIWMVSLMFRTGIGKNLIEPDEP